MAPRSGLLAVHRRALRHAVSAPVPAAISYAIASVLASLAFCTHLQASEIQKGEYLTRAADCIGCHTSNPSRPFAGGYRVPTPFGDVFSTNITPDLDTGIGRYSADEFIRAVQQGVRRDGADLYPAMPYDSFAAMNREDVLAIRSYLLAQPPISQPRPANILPFPFNQRWTLALWKLANLHSGGFMPDRSRTAAWNRGAYLVEVLGHCGACHTPRNTTFGMDDNRKLAGGSAGIWQAFNITSDKIAGVGGWSDEELFRFLKTGAVPGKAYASGPMAETVMNSLQHLSDDDIRAMVAYLRDVPAQPGDERQPRFSWGNVPTIADNAGSKAQGSGTSAGGDLYRSLCSGCHGANGGGSADGSAPSLIHNTSPGAAVPDNVVMTILEGVKAGDVAERKSMAAFAGWLDDAQVAILANYVTAQFGNPEARVTAADVRQMRAGTSTAQTVLVLAGQALAVGGAGLLLGLLFLLAKRLRPALPSARLMFVHKDRR